MSYQSIMANYKRCNTKPIRIVGKKTGYTICGIPLVYTRSFYEEYSFNFVQDLVGSYLLSDLKRHILDHKGEDFWIHELVRHMSYENLVHWEYHDKPTENTIKCDPHLIYQDVEWSWAPYTPLHKELVRGPYKK